MRFVRDISISYKMLLALVIMMIALGSVLLLTTRGFDRQALVIRNVHDIALERTTLLNRFILMSERVQSDLFLISVLRFMNVPDREVPPLHDRLEEGLSHMGVIYGQIIRKWSLNPNEKDILKQMKSPLDVFSKEARQATDAVSKNPSFGILLVRSAAVPFSQFRQLLNKFLDFQKARIAQAESGSQRTVRTVKRTTLAISMVMVFIAILLTVLIGNRFISRPVRAITDVMGKLADGDLSAEITESGRGDEIGSMARAVEVFRENAIEKKGAEKALQESEEKYRGLIEGLDEAIYRMSLPDGKYEYMSPAARKIFGYNAEEFIENPLIIRKLMHPDFVEYFEEKWADLIEHKVSPTYKYKILDPEGNERWIVQSNTGIFDDSGNIIAIEGLCRDITKGAQAEEALRENEAKFRTILETIEDGYFEVDLGGNLTFFNDSLCKIFGYSKDELMGINNQQYTDKENAKELYQTFNRVYTTGKPDRGFDWEIIKKDGTKIIVEASISLRSDAGGEPIGFRGVVRDISEKQRLETQLQQAQKMESIGTLAGGIAHNFNNLLMGIQGNASIMFLDIDSSHPRHKNLKNIEKLIDNGAKLTAQLIGYAREGKYEVKPINLNQLVKEMSDTFGMTKKEITVHQELSEDLHGIEADQGQIEQILLNLYVNAVEAMPGGGDLFLKTMNITDKDMTGKLYKANPGNYVLLSVKDTGVGMDKETRKRIFEPFFTTKGLASGTGLGMASAYGTVKGHGGYIDVDSEKGKGTTFSIYLPATEEMIEQKKVLSDELVKGKGTVLLVDDEEMVLEAGKELLNHLGYEVLLAENGREALKLYKKNHDKIDLVLLDMVMPVMGGGEAFDRMKEINTNVKVLLSSGYSLEGEAKEILKRGCDAFIQKPFKMAQLSQKLMEVLDKK